MGARRGGRSLFNEGAHEAPATAGRSLFFEIIGEAGPGRTRAELNAPPTPKRAMSVVETHYPPQKTYVQLIGASIGPNPNGASIGPIPKKPKKRRFWLPFTSICTRSNQEHPLNARRGGIGHLYRDPVTWAEAHMEELLAGGVKAETASALASSEVAPAPEDENRYLDLPLEAWVALWLGSPYREHAVLACRLLENEESLRRVASPPPGPARDPAKQAELEGLLAAFLAELPAPPCFSEDSEDSEDSEAPEDAKPAPGGG